MKFFRPCFVCHAPRPDDDAIFCLKCRVAWIRELATTTTEDIILWTANRVRMLATKTGAGK